MFKSVTHWESEDGESQRPSEDHPSLFSICDEPLQSILCQTLLEEQTLSLLILITALGGGCDYYRLRELGKLGHGEAE